MNTRRHHQGDTKTFEELDFSEQAKAMSALQFRKQLDAHLRRASQEGKDEGDVLTKRLSLLENILADYRDRASGITASIIVDPPEILD